VVSQSSSTNHSVRVITTLTGVLPNFLALWMGLVGFEVAGVFAVGRERKKLMFNPQGIYNSQTSNPASRMLSFG
jgi:hypothetical protein